MPITEMTLSKKGDFSTELNAWKEGLVTAQAIDSDTNKDIVAINVKDVVEAAIQLINTHASNGLTYSLYGTGKATIPTTYNTEEWEEIVAAQAVAIDTNKVETITKGYTYLLVRAKRTVATNDATLEVHYHGTN